jgi:hypothetical protein
VGRAFISLSGVLARGRRRDYVHGGRDVPPIPARDGPSLDDAPAPARGHRRVTLSRRTPLYCLRWDTDRPPSPRSPVVDDALSRPPGRGRRRVRSSVRLHLALHKNPSESAMTADFLCSGEGFGAGADLRKRSSGSTTLRPSGVTVTDREVVRQARGGSVTRDRILSGIGFRCATPLALVGSRSKMGAAMARDGERRRGSERDGFMMRPGRVWRATRLTYSVRPVLSPEFSQGLLPLSPLSAPSRLMSEGQMPKTIALVATTG